MSLNVPVGLSIKQGKKKSFFYAIYNLQMSQDV